MRYASLDSPIGPLLVARNEQGITAIHFAPAHPPEDWVEDDGAFDDVRAQLEEYFQKRRTTFDLPLAPAGTGFQLAVWQALQSIPYGETRSYADIAKTIGRPNAVRAVGAANGANPLPIVVPCHRVIGSNGSLTGFGGGIRTKRWLLDLEQGTLFRV